MLQVKVWCCILWQCLISSVKCVDITDIIVIETCIDGTITNSLLICVITLLIRPYQRVRAADFKLRYVSGNNAVNNSYDN